MAANIGIIQATPDIGIIQSASTAYSDSLTINCTVGQTNTIFIGVSVSMTAGAALGITITPAATNPTELSMDMTCSMGTPDARLAAVADFTVAESIGIAVAGSIAALNSFTAGVVLEATPAVTKEIFGDLSVGVIAGLSDSPMVAFAPSLTLALTALIASSGMLAAVADFEIDFTIDAEPDASGSILGSIGIGVTLDITPTAARNAAGIFSLGMTTGPGFAVNSSFFPAIDMGFGVDGGAYVAGLQYGADFQLDSTFETGGESGWAATFSFGTSHEVSPMPTQLAAAGFVALGVTLDIPIVPLINGAESLGFVVQLNPQHQGNMGAQSALTFGASFETVDVGALLYFEDFILSITGDVTPVARAAFKSAFALGMTASIVDSATATVSGALVMGARLGIAASASLHAQNALALGITVATGFVGGRQYADEMTLGAGFDLQFLFSRGDVGPGIFGHGGAGTPGIFKPHPGSSVPGIFGPPDDDSVPGIFEP